jgi:hypothetical protein
MGLMCARERKKRLRGSTPPEAMGRPRAGFGARLVTTLEPSWPTSRLPPLAAEPATAPAAATNAGAPLSIKEDIARRGKKRKI